MRQNLMLYAALLAIPMKFVRAQQLPIERPEELAGRWEAGDGHGGVVGMNIFVTTLIDGAPKSLLGHQQHLDEFTIGLNQRKDGGQPMGVSFFTNSSVGVTWDGNHLRILAPQTADHPKIDISLVWNESIRQWSGHYKFGDFNSQVTLKRPKNAGASPFSGAWFDGGGSMNKCVHIVRQSDGGFTAWGDDISIPGRMRYASGIQPPAQSREHFGEMAKAKVISPNQILVELQAYTAMCCSHPFTAKISADGSTLVGTWLAGPNQASRSVKWKKMPEDSCFAAADAAVSH